MTLLIIVMMMSSNTVQSTACKSRRATTARLPLLLLLAAACSFRQPQSLHALAAATSPTLTQLVPKTTTLSKKKNLITIGHKFQSAAIATHNSILQMAKQEEEEEVDGDDETRKSKKSSTSVDDGGDRLPTGNPTYEPTSWYPTYYPTPSVVDGGADVEEESETTQVPTSEPTTPNTYDPASSIDGGESLVTDVPTKPSISITHEPTAAWNGDGFSSQGNTLKDEEAEVNTTTSPSPTAQPSSTIPTPYKTSFFTPTPTWTTIAPTTDSAKHVEKEAYASYAITLVPSQVPSSPSGATSSVPSAVSDDQDCPELFDESAFYVEGDVISTQGPLFCRSKGCRIIYKCSSPTLCNVVVPGKVYSEQGWVKIGNCGRLPMEEEQPTAANDVPSSFPTLQDEVVVPHHDVEESHLEDKATSRPTSHPTEWHFGFTPTSPTQSEHDHDSVQNSGLSVDLPRIICDISLSSSFTHEFEQEHILLVVMTKIIYDIFEMHLSKDMYDLTGVSLSVTTKKNLDGNGSDESDVHSTTIRLHAFFTGTASFSRSVPSQSDLIEVLLLHFSVDEFQHRLNFPLRLRTFDDPVKVNSVFFTLEDGSLVNVGYKNEQEEFALPAVASNEGEEASLSAHQVQIITIAITMVAMPFALAAIFLIVLKNMDEEEEVEYQEADDEASSNESPPEDEEEVLPSAPAAPVPVVDTNESAAAAAKVEINIPSTPSSAMMPLSDISESQSEWSSISDSFHYTMELESPAKVGLGIAAAGGYHYHYHQKGTPYVDHAAPFGLVPELWEHNDHLEVYEDYIIDV